MEHDNDPHLPGAPYAFYQHEDGQFSGMAYTQPHLPYQVMPNAPPQDLLQMRQLSLMPHQHQGYAPQGNMFPGQHSGGMTPVSPTRTAASMQLPPSPSPIEAAAVFDHPISPPVSGSDASADSQAHYQHSYSRESSSGAGSPPAAIRGSSLVHHRSQHRYNPTVPQSRSRRRRSSINDDQDFSDDGEQDGGGIGVSPPTAGSGMSGQHLAETLANSRKEATRRQRIEAEQKRRDELREGYARLKDVLPLSNQKSSKVSLLERATNYIANLDQSTKILHARLAALEAEVGRLREVNEQLSLTVAQHTGHLPTDVDLGLPPPPPHMVDPTIERPLSPPPDIHPPMHPHQPQPPQPAPQYHHGRTNSSASGSQASGSEY